MQVEPPGRGDALRSLRTLQPDGTSLWWRCHGRNRRAMTVDLHNEEGRKVGPGSYRALLCDALNAVGCSRNAA